MTLQASVGRHASRALRRQCYAFPASRRGLAAPASGSFSYQQGEAAGVKFATRDLAGPTSTLALVAKAGTRYQPLPGLAEGLEKFAFLNTHKRSALRLQRESELFGATLYSYHTRENVVIGAKFFRDDLPYFVELLNEVASETKYLDYEFSEGVLKQIHDSQIHESSLSREMAVSLAHGVAFHRGLGEPLHPTPDSPLQPYLSHEAIAAYSTMAYNKPNIAVVGNGIENQELNKWVGQFFKGLRSSPASGTPSLDASQTKYYGGEERVAHEGGNTMVLAFPGSSSFTGGFYKPEIAVLAALLGGQSTIKWSPGFSLLGKAVRPGVNISTKSAIYSDAGLLYVAITGNSASSVREVAPEVVKTIKSVAEGNLSSEEFKKAVALAKFTELEYGQEIQAGLELAGSGLIQHGKPYQLDESAAAIGKVTEAQVKKAAKTLLEFKASVATVGDLFQLPYAEEIGLTV